MKYRLTVWESRALHGKSDGGPLIENVWESNEFDTVHKDIRGDLVISKFDPDAISHNGWVIVGIVRVGNWSKFQLEPVEPEETIQPDEPKDTEETDQVVDTFNNIGSFARADDPFADAAPPEPVEVIRPESGAHAAPDSDENVQAITPEMRARVLEKLGEHYLGKPSETANAVKPTSTDLLGLQETTALPVVGEVFK